MFVTSLLSRLSSAGKKHPLEYYDSLLPSVGFVEGIPHNIFQTNKSKENIKDPIRHNIEKIKNLNPGWNYSLFDDSDIESFIQDEYGDIVFSFYKRISPEYGAAKADFFRYLVVYRYGGVYLDIKSSMNKPLSDILSENDSYILSYWDNLPGQSHEANGHYSAIPKHIERGEIMQWYLIASAGHPLLRKVITTMLCNIDRYNPYVDGVGWTGTVTTTGPVMYTKTVYETLNSPFSPQYPVRWVDLIGNCGFEYSIMEQQNGFKDKDSSPRHTSLLSSDYRKNSSPVIKNGSRLINAINTRYLSILSARANHN